VISAPVNSLLAQHWSVWKDPSLGILQRVYRVLLNRQALVSYWDESNPFKRPSCLPFEESRGKLWFYTIASGPHHEDQSVPVVPHKRWSSRRRWNLIYKLIDLAK
jgi:hypothetical protein